jgi:hypothetical protein
MAVPSIDIVPPFPDAALCMYSQTQTLLPKLAFYSVQLVHSSYLQEPSAIPSLTQQPPRIPQITSGNNSPGPWFSAP